MSSTEVSKLKKLSLFQAFCLILGMDPDKTSLHEYECMKQGLDPEKTSAHTLDCIKRGLNPEATSIDALTKYKREHPIPEVEKYMEEHPDFTKKDIEKLVWKYEFGIDVREKDYEEVNRIYWENPVHYKQIIPLHFRMKWAAAEQKYEDAANLRDRIKKILDEE